MGQILKLKAGIPKFPCSRTQAAKTRKPIPKIVFFMIITSLHLTFLLLTDNNA